MRLLLCGYAFALIVALAVQVTIDATGPVRQRRREPTSGSGGGIGRKLPLRVAIVCQNGFAKDVSHEKVEFIITNSGTSDLGIPVSPNPGDFESKNPKEPYSVLEMNLYLTDDTGKGPERYERALDGGARLYGNRALPTSIFKLTPGHSIRILTNAKVFNYERPFGSGTKIVAHIELNKETVTTIGTATSARIYEIGSATSEDYSPGTICITP
jgi:hypothetical protein